MSSAPAPKPKVPPGPRSRLPAGVFFKFRRDPLRWLEETAAKYGDVVRFRLGTQDAYFLNHPDLVKEVLVTQDRAFKKGRALERSKRLLGEGLLTSEGDFHRRQRRLAQPAFHRQRIAGYAEAMVGIAERQCSAWQDGQELDIHHEMMRMTLTIVARTLFDADVEADAEGVGRALTEVMELFTFMLAPFSEFLEKLPLPPMRRFERVRKDLDRVINRIIRERREEGRDHGDLLSMLMNAEDVEGDGGKMSDRQLRDELITLILAGHETTANALTWTWYLLALHPQVEVWLHEEWDRVLAGHRPVAEDYAQLRYTEMVFSESMRLFPPAWVIGRRAIQEVRIGDYLLPKAALVLVSQYTLHRDPRFFPEPERFDPQRWTPAERAARPRFAYFPFGAGSRQCIGEGFAWMEAVMLLATIGQQWRMKLVSGQKIETFPAITLRPKGPVRMLLTRR